MHRSRDTAARLAILLLLLGTACAGCRTGFLTMAELRRRFELPELPTTETHPEAEAVVLISAIDTEMYATEIGLATDRVVHRVVRVLRNPETRATVEFDLYPGEQLVRLEARRHDPDGRIVPLPRSAFDLGRVVADESVFDDDGADHEGGDDAERIEKNTIRLRFPGVEAGSILEYRYRVRRHGPYLYDSWAVQELDPVLYTSYTLRVPRYLFDDEGNEWDWRYRYYRCARIGAPEVYEERNPELGRTLTYRWLLRDVPGFRPEPRMPPLEEHLAFARFAHIAWKSWDDVVGSYWRLHLRDALRPDEAVAETVARLVPPGTAPRDRVRILVEHVQGMGRVGLELGQGGLTPTRPKLVLERGRGDVKDKAVLLVSLLRAAEVAADPALVVTRDRGEFDAAFPHWNFNHVLVLVELDGAPIWIDPAGRHHPLGQLPWRCEAREAVVVRPGGQAEIMTTPGSSPEDNSRSHDVRLVVGADGTVRGEARVVLTGEPASELMVALDDAPDPDEALRALSESEIRAAFPDAEVASVALSPPAGSSPGQVRWSFPFTADQWIDESDVLPRLRAAPFTYDAGLDLVGQVERRYPVEIGYPFVWSRRLVVDTTRSAHRIVAIPSPVEIRTREVSFRSRYALQREDVLEAEESLEIRTPRLLTRAFEVAREIQEAEAMAGARAVVLRGDGTH